MKQYEILRPSCYSRFSCKGGSCRFTCCSEWGITMSLEEYKKLKKKGIPLTEKICPVEKELKSDFSKYKMILNKQGSCPFLTEERLCSLQLTYGAGILSETCKEFPRIYHRYLNKLESGLSLGCEKVLELILEEQGSLEFINTRKSMPEDQRFNTYIDDRKRRKYPHLIYYYDIQSLCLCLLQAKEASLEDRLILLGMALTQIEKLIKEGKANEIPQMIAAFLNNIDGSSITEELDSVNSEHVAVFYHNLLVAKKYTGMGDRHYIGLIENIGRKLQISGEDGETVHYSLDRYREGKERFQNLIKNRKYFLENLMTAFLFQTNLPFRDAKNGLWKDFTFLVWVYSMLKFTLSMTLEEDSTEEDLIDCCAIMFRKLGHNKSLYQWVIDNFEKNKCNTLAHMAVFLKS